MLKNNSPKTKKQTVLLVEDDVILNDAFTMMLDKMGFNVVPVFNGKEALDQIALKTPDIILLDLLMPVMDGKEFLRKYKNEKKIPIIVFSNLDSKDDVQEALDLGASRYMLKAWASPQELAQVISEMI